MSDKLAGWEVAIWLSQAELCEALQLTPRQVRNLHRRGLPLKRENGQPRYPLPHALAWHVDFRHRTAVLRQKVHRLPLELALAMWRARAREVEARLDGHIE